LVLREDDANRQLANGFLKYFSTRQIQLLRAVGGWDKALEHFISDHVSGMERCANRLIVLLIDFDGREQRLQEAKDRIPTQLTQRVFIRGTLTEPEALKAYLGSYETIGLAMAKDCRDETATTWDTIYFDTMQASLNVHARTCDRYYSPEPGRLIDTCSTFWIC